MLNLLAVIAGVEEIVADDVERDIGYRPRIELAHRPGGGITRVRERLVATLDALLVELDELAPPENDLAAYREALRRFARQTQRERSDRARIMRHIVSRESVAPRRSANESPVLVDDLEG